MKTIFRTCLILLAVANACSAQSQWVHYDNSHTLVYSNDDLGNHIPDFSYAGYGEGGVPLPTNAPVKEIVSAISGDNTANIQNTINFVSSLPMVNGFRGVVLLNPGTYEVDGSLTLGASGVVLRGSDNSPTGTVLHFVGNSRQTIAVQGSGSVSQQGSSYNLTNVYVPLGATNFNVTDASTFSVGNLIVVRRPVTQTWIDAIGMNATNINWSPSSGLGFERTITAINGNQLAIDIPLFSPIEQQWCTGYVYRVTESSGRITNSAIENLRLRSDFSDASTNWGNSRALNFDNCKNCWFRDIVVDNYYNGINSGSGAKWCTVQDCYFVSNTIPTTSAGAAAFGGSGQMLLWQRCYSSNSTTYHVFVTQAAVPGPNVFLNFVSSGNGYDCGPHQRWAAGVLIDNNVAASISGGNTGIKLENRGTAGSGQGYGAGYSIIYNGDSKGIINEIPQVNHHYNWAIGRGSSAATFIHRSDDGIFDATNGTVNPRSLYLEQLRERLGGAAVENIGYPLFTFSIVPPLQTVVAGGNATCSVNIGDPTLMSNIVALAVSGLPAGISAVLSTNSITGAGSVGLLVTASNSVVPGNYAFNVIGSNAGVTHTSVVNLVVADFSLSASPPEQSVTPGTGTSYTLTVMTNHDISGSINFGLSGLPANADAYFSPVSLDGAGSATLNIITGTNIPAGDYVLTIYGNNGSSVASTTVTLHIVTSLVAWLTFDDGTTGDSSGHGNNGILIGGATVVSDAPRGKVLSLDGASGYVDLGNDASLDLSAGGQATIAAWVKVAVTHNHNSVVTKGEWKDAYSLLIKGDTSPPNLLWTGNDTSVFSANPVPAGVWTHVAVTINGALTSFYINGQLSGATNQDRGNPIDQTTTGVCIGREQYSGSLPAGRWFFNGELDDVRIYNIALTQAQIQSVMNNVAPSFTNDPLTSAAANAGQLYSGSLAGDATDPNSGDFLAFSKVGGPAWLSVTAHGQLSGTPLLSDAGTNIFTVRVTDSGGLFDEATLNLPVNPAPARIASVTVSGGNLVCSGSNGVPGRTYYVLASTDLALPNWTVIATNSFDNGGNFVFTNGMAPNSPQQFYRLQLP